MRPEEAWCLLQKVDVKQHYVDDLERIVRLELGTQCEDDPVAVLGVLREYCEEHIHESFDADRVWAYLKSKGLEPSATNREEAVEAFRRTLARQKRRVEPFEPRIGLVPRSDVESVLAKLQDPDGKQILIVDGQAGLGKSTVVTQAATRLADEGWFVAVARMDSNASIQSSNRLGQEMGLTKSPTHLLAEVSRGTSALLVFDQLDAVSLYSGRMPDNFESVDEAITEAKHLRNLKILLVVRTVDHYNDPRLSALGSDTNIERHSLTNLNIEDVITHFRAHAMEIPTSRTTLELLCSPLHLAVFCRLSDSARSDEYTTLSDLFERYTKDVRSRIERNIQRLRWDRIVGDLVTYMSANEVLTAPHAVINADQREIDLLVSESVLVRDTTGFAFFHESFFDFLFARSFIAKGGDLHGFLVESGQYLFRRAQTRQVLEHLAGTNPYLFRETVVKVLSSDQIRPHLKSVVVSVLRRLQPTPEDWAALDELAWTDSSVASNLVGLLGQASWFEAADELDVWEPWLDNPQRIDAVFPKLIMIAKERPERVEELVRPHIGESEAWNRRLCSLIEWSLNSQLIDLAVDLMDRGILDGARGPIAVNSDFWSVLWRGRKEDAAGTARLIGRFLHRGLTRAREGGSDDPFEAGYLSQDSQSTDVIGEVANRAPSAFVRHVLPFVIEVAKADQHDVEGRLPVGRRWAIRWESSDHTVDDVVFAATETALKKLAVDNSEECAAAIQPLHNIESRELRFLVCRALTAMSDPDEAVRWMVTDQRNLSLGWADSPRWASRQLIEACSSQCSSDLFRKVEMQILEYSVPSEPRRWRGHGKYELLSALDTTRMSKPAKRTLQELQRRFLDSPPAAPKPIVARQVEPPISDDASKRMTDRNWIQALERHSREETTWHDDRAVGGASQLAGVLGQRTREDPQRYARLALRFTNRIPHVAMNAIIDNVERALDEALLADLCEHAHRLYGSETGLSVCRAITRANTVNPRLVGLISAYSRDPDPEQESDWDLFTAGVNSVRGQAALAAAAVLFPSPDHIDALLEVVKALACDHVLAVRVCTAQAVAALSRHATDVALDITECLFAAPINVLNALPTENLLRFAVLNDRDRFAQILTEGLADNNEVAKRAGRIWAVARWHQQLPLALNDDFRMLPTNARRGAAEVFASNVSLSIDVLPLVFDDHDPTVRQQSSLAMGRIEEVPASLREDLLDAFLASSAFPEQSRSLIFTLRQMKSRLPQNTINVCERIIDNIGADLGNPTTAGGLGTYLLTVILRLFRQSHTNLRARCLDIVDRLTEFNIYNIDQELDVLR